MRCFRYTLSRCLCASLVLLILQFLLAFLLLNSLEKSNAIGDDSICFETVQEDLKFFTDISIQIGFNFIVMDNNYINLKNNPVKIFNSSLHISKYWYTLLALDQNSVSDRMVKVLGRFVEEEFIPVTFYNIKPKQLTTELKRVETHIVLQRKATFLIIILHPREDNTWWFGDILSDPAFELKLKSMNLTLKNYPFKHFEGAIERFETVLDEDTNFLMPKDTNKFLFDVSNSRFVECNTTRAALFHRQFHVDRSPQALRFRHKVWKMLSRVKTVLESLSVEFWLSSGTVLGYFRECDVIAHSKDVDIGIWASSYSEKIISEMQNHGFILKISLGLPNDSMELSFFDQSGVKLDIFFYYKEENYYWNGGTQVKSGKKFKYTFPKFTLCWTLFKDLRVRVPCETEAFVRANYGPNWFTPIKSWDWKTSPSNVKQNGVWTAEQLSSVIKIYL